MTIRIRTALLAALLPVAGAAWAADQIVPIEQEPQHQLKFRAPGGEELVSFSPAGFKWRDSAAPVEFVNVGDESFQAVDIVVK